MTPEKSYSEDTGGLTGRHGVNSRMIRELTALSIQKGESLQWWLNFAGHSPYRPAEDITVERFCWIRRHLLEMPDRNQDEVIR